jgi:hypothetical protein
VLVSARDDCVDDDDDDDDADDDADADADDDEGCGNVNASAADVTGMCGAPTCSVDGLLRVAPRRKLLLWSASSSSTA